MAKRAMSFKPTPECEVQLAELMGRFKFDRTSTVIMAIDVAHRALMVRTTLGIEGDPPEIVDAVTVGPQGPNTKEKKASPSQQNKLAQQRLDSIKTRVLSREEREAKIAAAQGWLGKKK